MIHINKSTFTQRRHQSGAVLVGVLVFLLVITLIIASVSEYFQRVVDDTILVDKNINDHAIAHAKLNELVYLLSTQRITRAGVSKGISQESVERDDEGRFVRLITGDEVRTDGFEYTNDEIKFRIQNTLGLVPINDSSQFWLRQYLSQSGVSLLLQNSLLDKLHDYADHDDIPRAVGDEGSDRYLPANYLLQTCFELYSIPGWAGFLKENAQIIEACSLLRGGRVNINAMPEHLLRIFWPQYADNIISARARGEWFINYQSFFEMVPNSINIPEEYFTTIGDGGFVVRSKKSNVSLKRYVSIGTNNIKPFSYRNVLN